ncbi:TPA: hypothetical protein AABQ09_001105 [Neisseria gonorrhoeae]
MASLMQKAYCQTLNYGMIQNLQVYFSKSLIIKADNLIIKADNWPLQAVSYPLVTVSGVSFGKLINYRSGTGGIADAFGYACEAG